MAGTLFTDPVQLFGFIFIIITMLIYLILALKVYRDYLMNRSKPTLAFSLTFGAWGVALLFLGLERVALSELSEYLGIIPGLTFAYIALVFSSLALVFIDLFAFYATFANQAKRLIIISISLSIIYLGGMFSAAGLIGGLGPGSEIVFPSYTNIIMLLTVLPLFFIPIITLIYYSYTMRVRSPPHAKGAVWLAVAIFLVILSYVPEILGPADLINYLRTLYTVSSIIFYFCFRRFIELHWAQKIHHLYICLADRGICLYDHSFRNEEVLDCSLVTGFISGISSLIQEITNTQKKLKVIDVEDIRIILEYGKKNTLGVLMTEENFKILRVKLGKLLEIFETEFKSELSTFSGRVDIFERTTKFVDRIFTNKEIF
ncbi:MAG: hypothetical protein LUQ65_13095 [Candidatus Helarchaeota archaeon]|nr:hypothetical protein [Candidatus Helarchaeota archaeon]